MATFTALTTLSGREAAEALGAAMENLDPPPVGIGVFEVEDGSHLWEVGGYFEGPPDIAALALLEAVFGAASFAVSELPDVDWVAKVRRELGPVEAGRFFVYGSHDAGKLPEGRIGLLIEAAMAFGTGHHGTTLGCLRALDRLACAGFQPASAIDIGCGTAVLAMAAAKIWPIKPIASDIDRVAVEVAAANSAANGLADRVRCVEAAGLDHPELAAMVPCDLIFANILKGPLISLAPDVAAASSIGGYAILSGILLEQASAVADVYCANGYDLQDQESIGEWSTLILQKNKQH